jgi:tetratricopeptide (TPR) repeat protein
VIQLTKGGKGEGCISPGEVDLIGERLLQQLKSNPGGVIALASLDYLVSQNGFQHVLRLVQFLREDAERADAHVLLSVNPAALEKREMALLEGEGEVLREEVAAPPAAPSAPEPPAMTMMRYLETLEKEATRRPCLLVVDDVQWADPDSLRTLQFLARNIRSLPVLLIGTMRVEEWRSPEEKAEQGLEDILGKIDEERSLVRLPLRGLGEDESREFAERTIGLPFRKGDVAREGVLLKIFQRAEGNPYFVQETMRQLVQEGMLRREGHDAIMVHTSSDAKTVSIEALPVPPTLRRLVARRLSMLRREEMDLLRWASVVGSEFDLPPLADALHRPGVELSALLLSLERDLHILEAQPECGRWSFAHPLVWEVTLAETAPEELRRKALILADWWAEHRGNDVETTARLYHDAEEPARGLPWTRKAVDLAISQHAPETVERYHRWLQDLLRLAGADSKSCVEEGLSVCERHLLETGGSPALSRTLTSIVNASATPDERLPARILLAYSLTGHDFHEISALVDTVNTEMSRDHVQLPPKWDVVRGIVKVDLLSRQGKARPAIDELRGLSLVAEDVQEPWVRGLVAHRMGFCCAYAGLIAEAKDALANLRKLAEESGQSLLELWCFSLESAIAELEGNLRLCEESNIRAVSAARRRGDMRNASIMLANLVTFAAARGEFDAAREYLLEGHKICSQLGFREAVEPLLMVECYMLWDEQRWADLVPKLMNALSRTMGDETGKALAHSFLAEGNLELGDVPSARKCLAEAERRKDELEPGELVNVLRVRARVEDAEGDPSTARRTLAEAAQMFEENMDSYWGAWLKAEMARWEYRHGDTALASSFRAEAESLFEKSGVLPAGKPEWLQDIPPRAWES